MWRGYERRRGALSPRRARARSPARAPGRRRTHTSLQTMRSPPNGGGSAPSRSRRSNCDMKRSSALSAAARRSSSSNESTAPSRAPRAFGSTKSWPSGVPIRTKRSGAAAVPAAARAASPPGAAGARAARFSRPRSSSASVAASGAGLPVAASLSPTIFWRAAGTSVSSSRMTLSSPSESVGSTSTSSICVPAHLATRQSPGGAGATASSPPPSPAFDSAGTTAGDPGSGGIAAPGFSSIHPSRILQARALQTANRQSTLSRIR